METTSVPRKIHPLMAGAAVSVILVSLLGAAAITGILPTSRGNNAPTQGDITNVAPVDANGRPIQGANSQGVAGQPNAAARNICYSCGHVESIQLVQHQGKTSGVGVVAGAVLGGVLGNQVGGGRGRELATVAGAVGGGYAGNEVEKRNNTTTSYAVHVKTDDGKMHTYNYASQPPFSIGQPVRIEHGTLVASN